MFSKMFGGASRHDVSACVVESLEARQFLSATTVLASLRPLAEWPAHVRHQVAAVHEMGPRLVVGSSVKKKTKAAPAQPSLLGVWSGNFTDNSTRAVSVGSIDFHTQRKQSFVGAFNMSAVAGNNGVSAVTLQSNRRFLVVLKLPGKQQMSMAGNLTVDGKSIIGRYSVEGARSKWSTGVFTLILQPKPAQT